jgi:hypothetical protein
MQQQHKVPVVQLVIYWAVVGVPSAWAVWQVITKAVALFQ